MELSFSRCDLQLAHNWMVASSQASGGKRIYPSMLLQLRARDGTIGYGEASPSLRYHETVDTCMAFVRQIDASQLSFDDVEGSMRYVESLSRGDFSPKGAVNVALLDGAAKKAGQPLHQYLGLEFVEGKHVSSFTIGLDTPEMIRQKTLVAEPLPILKLKVGAPDDAANLAAVRAIAPQKKLRVDANEAWLTKEEALEQIELLATDRHLEYVEQPMPASHPDADFAWLKARSPLPIVGDESYRNAADAARCAELFHGVNVKLCKTGGITRGMEALLAARGAGLKTMIGCMVESSILTSAGAHLASLADWLDLDGMLLITNDPFAGVTSRNSVLSFADATERYGLRASPRQT